MTRRGLVAAVAVVAVLAAVPAAASAVDTPATPDPAVTCPYTDGIPDQDQTRDHARLHAEHMAGGVMGPGHMAGGAGQAMGMGYGPGPRS